MKSNPCTRRVVIFVPASARATVEAAIFPGGKDMDGNDLPPRPDDTFSPGVWRVSDGKRVGSICNWAMAEKEFQRLKARVDVDALKALGVRWLILEDSDPAKCSSVSSRLPTGYTLSDPNEEKL